MMQSMKTFITRFFCLAFVLISALTVPNGAVGAGKFSRFNLDASYQDTIDDRILFYLETKQHNLCPSPSLYEPGNKCEEQTRAYVQKIRAQYELEIVSNESIDIWWLGYLDGRFDLNNPYIYWWPASKAYKQGAKTGRTAKRRFEVRYGTQPIIKFRSPYEAFNDEKVTKYIKDLYNQSMDKINDNESIDKNRGVDLYEESVKALLN